MLINMVPVYLRNWMNGSAFLMLTGADAAANPHKVRLRRERNNADAYCT